MSGRLFGDDESAIPGRFVSYCPNHCGGVIREAGEVFSAEAENEARFIVAAVLALDGVPLV